MSANRAWATRLGNAREAIDGERPAQHGRVAVHVALAALVVAMLLPAVADAIILNAINDVWIRERQPTATFESDLISVWNSHNTSDMGKRRYGVVEFDVSSLNGIAINVATIGLWNFGHGFSDQNKAIKQSAAFINTTGGTTSVPNMTWNAYQNEYAVGAVALSGLGAFSLPAQVAPNAYSYSSLATSADRAVVASAASSGNQRLTLVFIADETSASDLAHSWGDGETLSSMSPQLLINEEQVNLTLRINTTTGVMSIVNPGIDPTVDTTFDIDGFVINSPAGALNVSGFTGIGAGGQPGWEIIAPTSNNLSELNLSASTELSEGSSRLLGTGYATGTAPDTGLTFTYNVAGVGTAFGQVEYVTGGVAGDYNSDGVVGSADYIVWRNGGSPDSSNAGYILWRSHFGQHSGVASGDAVAATVVPEPGTMTALVASLAFAIISARKTGSRGLGFYSWHGRWGSRRPVGGAAHADLKLFDGLLLWNDYDR